MTTPRRNFLTALASIFVSRSASSENQQIGSSIIDDLSREPPIATMGTSWQLFTDTVMGGVSEATMARETIAGRAAIRLQGRVSLENKGGFVQISLDFRPDGGPIDASPWRGIELDACGMARNTRSICGRRISRAPGNRIARHSGQRPTGRQSGYRS